MLLLLVTHTSSSSENHQILATVQYFVINSCIFLFLEVILLAVLCLITLFSLLFSEFLSLPCFHISVAGKLQQFVGILNSIYMCLEGSGTLYPIDIFKVQVLGIVWQSRGQDSVLLLPWAQFQFPVKELRSQKPCMMYPKTKKGVGSCMVLCAL